ncbi:hypothetical protein AN219_09795 [Streptomyces nanshensis]|nr:hypothetical protein AN219_09795 [Streptomyces nanshensis]
MHGPTHAPPPARPRTANSPASAARWLWTALALGTATLTVILLVEAGWRPLLRVDGDVAGLLHAHALANPAWTGTNRVLTDWVWDPVTMRILVGVAAVWVWLRGERLLALWCVATAALGVGVQQGLKALLDRERPQWQQPVDSAHFAAMPSGHSMTAAVACVLVLWLVQRSGAGQALRATVLALVCISVAGVCLTRIVLGVHWLTDTVVGAMLGIALASASAGLWISLENRKAAEPARTPADD